MYAFLAWFAVDAGSARRFLGRCSRAEDDLGQLVPATHTQRRFGDSASSLSVWTTADQSAYQWSATDDDERVAAVSLGIPVGAPPGTTPLAMARRLLDGHDIHADLVPPFGFVALDRIDRRVVIQQDWLGQCRLFTATFDGGTVFSNRPTLVAALVGGRARLSRDGWTSFALSGHFGGDTSPVDGVRLMSPGERATFSRVGPGWRLTTERRHAIDDIVRAGVAAGASGPATALDTAAASLTATIASVGRLYQAPIALGLSGGKDSRLIAAACISAGLAPVLHTNDDAQIEADVAGQLVNILAARRGLRLSHTTRTLGAPANVLDVGLHERTTRLQHFYDFQFPVSYLMRAAAARRLPTTMARLSLSGAAGEIATGYWYPARTDELPETIERAAVAHMMAAVHHGAAAPSAVRRERARIRAILSHANSIGLVGSHQLDYLYLMERMRRWSTSAYTVGLVTPFLSPGVVSAAFALTVEQKRNRALHDGLLRRFVPEWSDVGYVSGSAAPSRAARVWDGDGATEIRRLFRPDRPDPLARLLNQTAIAPVVAACAGPDEPDPRTQKTLQTFVSLAVASDKFEPWPTTPRPWRTVVRQRVRNLPGVRHVRAPLRASPAAVRQGSAQP